MSQQIQTTEDTPLDRLRRAVGLLESEEAINSDYILGVKAPAAESVLTDQNLTAYKYHEVPLDREVRHTIQDTAASQARDFLGEVEEHGQNLEEYNISNTKRDSVPPQFVKADDVEHRERYIPLFNSTPFKSTTYDEQSDIGFQVLRLKSERTEERLMAFQRFTKRQISVDSDNLRLTMSGDSYDSFDRTVVTIPEQVDCIWYQDTIYVFRSKQFEYIFDYLEQYKRQANAVLEGLEKSDLNIHNMEEFVDSIRGDRRALRKMDSVQQRGLYDSIDRSEVEDVVDEFDLGLEVETDDSGEWGVTIPDLRKKWDVIRLLDDDHVVSYLTDSQYQVYGKYLRN